jgi:hypothetical protein
MLKLTMNGSNSKVKAAGFVSESFDIGVGQETRRRSLDCSLQFGPGGCDETSYDTGGNEPHHIYS